MICRDCSGGGQGKARERRHWRGPQAAHGQPYVSDGPRCRTDGLDRCELSGGSQEGNSRGGARYHDDGIHWVGIGESSGC
jgi:hypothetical protein